MNLYRIMTGSRDRIPTKQKSLESHKNFLEKPEEEKKIVQEPTDSEKPITRSACRSWRTECLSKAKTL